MFVRSYNFNSWFIQKGIVLCLNSCLTLWFYHELYVHIYSMLHSCTPASLSNILLTNSQIYDYKYRYVCNIWFNCCCKSYLCTGTLPTPILSHMYTTLATFYFFPVWAVCHATQDLTLRKIAIWLTKIAKNLTFFSKKLPLVIFWKKLKFLAFFFEKMSSFWQLFVSQMAIFRRVR